MLGSEAVIHSDGLVGCFRGLVMNNEVVNLYAYMNARFPDMIQKHCRPSCDPNPCLNGATCVEYWGSYKCVCENPLAHYGYNCETGIFISLRIPKHHFNSLLLLLSRHKSECFNFPNGRCLCGSQRYSADCGDQFGFKRFLH